MDPSQHARHLIEWVKEGILAPLEELKGSVEAMVELVLEKMGIRKPRVSVVANPIDECGILDRPGAPCSQVMGKYFAEEWLLALDYRFNIPTLLHLLAHHLQQLEVGSGYGELRRIEELRLPWELRPMEIDAVVKASRLASGLDPRVYRIWQSEVRPRAKEVEANLAKARSMANAVLRYVEQGIEKNLHPGPRP